MNSPRLLSSISLVFALFLQAAPSHAQEAARGIVIDREANTALAGATVGVKETGEVVVSDAAGRFAVRVEPGRTTRSGPPCPGTEYAR